MILAGTGHRPSKIGVQEQQIRAEIRRALSRYTPTAVISGFAQGFDQWLAEESMKLGISVVAAIPFEGQECKWPASVQAHYRELLRHVAAIHMLAAKPKTYPESVERLHERNAWMVDTANGVVACWDGEGTGGTAHCVRYAKAKGKLTYCFDPYTLEERT